MSLADTLSAARDAIDPTLSVQHANAWQHLAFALAELAAAPSDQAIAIGRLLAAYAVRQAERYTIRDGLSVSLAEATAGKLAGLVNVAQALVASDAPAETLWIDDGGVSLDVSAAELVEHAPAYTLQFSRLLAWVSAKRKEIEAAADPLAVSLD